MSTALVGVDSLGWGSLNPAGGSSGMGLALLTEARYCKQNSIHIVNTFVLGPSYFDQKKTNSSDKRIELAHFDIYIFHVTIAIH